MRYMHSYLTLLMSNINNQLMQLMQIIWNAMLYSQHFTFHWKLPVLEIYLYHGDLYSDLWKSDQ